MDAADAGAGVTPLDGLCRLDDGDLPPIAPVVDKSLACGLGTDAPGPLFTNDLGTLPADYVTLHALCQRMTPDPGTRDDLASPPLAADLRAYLRSLLDRPALQRALAHVGPDPEARLGALADVWLRGNALEHVLCGDLNPNGNVGGLHLWAELYLAEREGRANYLCRREGENDPVVASVSYTWTPPGRVDPAPKPLGSFVIGMSPACLLAVGYTAITGGVAPKPGSMPSFRAELYGATRDWALGVEQGALVTVYPLAEGP